MSSQLSLNVGINKEHAAVFSKPIGKENPQAEAEAAKVSQGPVRETGKQWENRVVKNGQKETHLSTNLKDSVSLRASSVATPDAIKAPSLLSYVRNGLDQLKKNILEQFEAHQSNRYSHNRLLGKVSDWMSGFLAAAAMRLGVSPKELDDVRARVRENLINQNQVAMFQVVYDGKTLDVVG